MNRQQRRASRGQGQAPRDPVILRADDLHARGLLAYQAGAFDRSVSLICAAIAAKPYDASFHFNLANALQGLGEADKALTAYRKAISLKHDYAEAHSNLGALLGNLGRHDESLTAFNAAISLRPDYAQAHSNLSALLGMLGRYDEALTACNTALGLKPDHADAHSNLSALLRILGRFDEALTACKAAISLKPDYAEAHSNLGALLRTLGRFDEAITACNRAIGLKPGYAEAHSNLGNALRGLGRLDEALAAYNKAISLKPDYAEAHSNLASLLDTVGRFDEALTACNTAIRIQPGYAKAHENMGIVFDHLCRLEEALAAFDTAISLTPDDAGFNFNQSCALLRMGLFPKGWDQYEWRWKNRHMAGSQRHFAQPIWHGDIDAGKTLLIHAEQGFGDTLQFCRYATLAAEHGMRVNLEVPRPLVRLLGNLPGVDQVVGQGDALPHFDVHAPMMSLPRLFGTTVATIPGKTPYLRADEGAAALWRQRLSMIAGQGRRIGLVWAGNPKTHCPDLASRERRRSISPEFLAPLFKTRGLKFFSLQKDGPAAPAEFPLIDLMQEMEDFADTAALIANLDLVISVDTAVAHLAAAIGKPVWLLNRFDSCWRWLIGRRDSPWYPELRLYNQPQPGDWKPVVAEITADLILFQNNCCR
jgi:tetratricopeptide (TPR) repeat protein